LATKADARFQTPSLKRKARQYCSAPFTDQLQEQHYGVLLAFMLLFLFMFMFEFMFEFLFMFMFEFELVAMFEFIVEFELVAMFEFEFMVEFVLVAMLSLVVVVVVVVVVLVLVAFVFVLFALSVVVQPAQRLATVSKARIAKVRRIECPPVPPLGSDCWGAARAVRSRCR
jgi:hypothetical protein